MSKKFGWLLMLMASFTVVSGFADEAREDEKQAEEVAVVDDCGPAVVEEETDLAE